jgi:hypothetical protein
MEQLNITIKGGIVEVEVDGVKGSRCLQLTQAIEELIGRIDSRSLKKELYIAHTVGRNICIEKFPKQR